MPLEGVRTFGGVFAGHIGSAGRSAKPTSDCGADVVSRVFPLRGVGPLWLARGV